MTDYHVHIGQFNEVYYDAHKVFGAIEDCIELTGVKKVLYSSTSSCRYDVELFRVEEEIEYARNFSSALDVQPYLWFVPKYAEDGIKVESALKSFDYAGIKIHSFAQKWDLKNPLHYKTLDEIFGLSTEQNKLILIHTGFDKCCRPERFEDFFKRWPHSHPVLAHSRPCSATLKMLKKYPNIKCDISFADLPTIKKLFKTFGQNRILFGTDFPISNYYSKHKNLDTVPSLVEQYIKDCMFLPLFSVNNC